MTDTLLRENQRLRELTELKEEREDFTLASAYIITWDSNDWTSSFTITRLQAVRDHSGYGGYDRPG